MELKIDEFRDVKCKFLKREDQDYIDEVRYYEKKLILVIKKFDTHKKLEEEYFKVLDKVAAHIQDKIEDEEDNLRWNIYLVFVIKENNDREKQKKIIKEIEIDKYCCKKYVLSNINSKEINKIIEGSLPIFINLEKIKSPQKDENAYPQSETKLKIPSFIEKYLKNEKKNLEEFLELTFNNKMIDQIYKGDKNED